MGGFGWGTSGGGIGVNSSITIDGVTLTLGEWLRRAAGNVNVIDDFGNDNIMVPITREMWVAAAQTLGLSSAIINAGLANAFVVNNTAVNTRYVAKYLASDNGSGEAVSVYGADPWAAIDFATAKTACEAKGAGWSLVPNALYAVIAMISYATYPGDATGNTQHGRSHSVTTQIGVRSDGLAVTGASQGTHGRTLTGSGPDEWAHNGSAFGIDDLVGNAQEWTGGIRLQDGEIQVIPPTAAIQADEGAASTVWRAIRSDTGALVDPASPGGTTLHYDVTTGVVLATATAGTTGNALLKDVGAGAISPVPDIAVVHGLYSWAPTTIPAIGRVYASVSGEWLASRGGSYGSGATAGGIASLLINNVRALATVSLGFRPAYVDL